MLMKVSSLTGKNEMKMNECVYVCVREGVKEGGRSPSFTAGVSNHVA